MTSVPGDADRDLERVGGAKGLARFLAEYGLERDDVQGLIAERTPPGIGGKPGPPEYTVHRSLLRSHGEFPCAGDAEALAFCRQIAAEMVDLFGISMQEAVARVNRHWSQAGPDGQVPGQWIVGTDIAFHEEPDYWARTIYYEPNCRWWVPGQELIPRPPP